MNQPERAAIPGKYAAIGMNFTTLAIVLLSAIGSYSVFHVTNWGPLMSSDSIEYITAARNLIAGRGLVIPGPSGDFHALQFFPPLYSLVLGLVGMSGIDVLVLARWINILVFGATLALIGFSIYKATSSVWLSIPPIALVLSYPIFSTKVFSEAMSEPLFFFFSVLQIVLMLSYFERQKFSLLLASSIMACLAFLTRNAGIVILMTGAVGILIFQSSSMKKRLSEVSLFFLVGGFPHILWRLSLFNQNVATQGIEFEGSHAWSRFASFRVQIVEKLWDWLPFIHENTLVSYRTRLFIFIVIAAIFTLIFFWLIRLVRKQVNRKWRADHGIRINGMLFLLIIIYLSVLLFSSLFVKPRPVLGGRLLSPVLMLALILPFTLMSLFVRLKPSLNRTQLLSFGLALVVMAFWTPTTIANATNLHADGRGLTSARWRASETIMAIPKLPADVALISNEADAILFFTGRPSYRIAELFTQSKRETFTRYGDDRQDPAERLFRENSAALVLFDSIKGQFSILYTDRAEQRLAAFVRGLALYSHHDDGSIYFYSELP